MSDEAIRDSIADTVTGFQLFSDHFTKNNLSMAASAHIAIAQATSKSIMAILPQLAAGVRQEKVLRQVAAGGHDEEEDGLHEGYAVYGGVALAARDGDRVLVGAADGPVVHDVYLIAAPVAHGEREYDGEPLDEEVEVLCLLARRAHLAGAAGAAHLADAAADAAGGGHGQRAHHATHLEPWWRR